MLKLFKNLKESWFAIIVIILLMCLEAETDLALPDYTSKIVNVGIQQGGIEEAIPEYIRTSQMDIALLLTEEDELIINSYNKTIYNDKEVYKLKEDLTKEDKEELKKEIAKPFLIATTMNSSENNDEIKKQFLDYVKTNPNMSDNNYDEYIDNVNIDEIIKLIPEEMLDSVLKTINEQYDAIPEALLEQSVIMSIKEEYKQIGIDVDEIQNIYILKTGLQMLGISVISIIAAISIMITSARVAAKLGKTLRLKVFEKVLSFSNKEFREFSTASLITRNTNDITQIQNLFSFLFRVVVYAPIIGIGGVIRVVNTSDLSMAWVIALAIGIIFIIVISLFIIAMPKFKKLQELIDKLNLVGREILNGVPVIRAFNTQRREEKRFENDNTNLTKTSLFVSIAMSLMMPGLNFVMNGVVLVIVWVGAKNVDLGVMQVGDIMAFIQYTIQIVISFLMISLVSILLPRAAVSAKRINEVLDTKPSIKDKEKVEKFDEAKKGLVEFKDVSFRYPDADTEIITDIDFTAKPGETTAIIGSTGSGKSTIVNLIPRFYDVTGGEILVDGVNIKDVSQKDLRSKIGFVPQKGILFSGTIESNIKYGNKDISDEEMMVASQIAQAEEFINARQEKYDSPIAQGGNNVSGGQKQRLSIARALAIDPEIYVFDDSFSALDLKTDSKLRKALANQTENKTVIIVAQRISTIMNAEQIIVLDEGKIVGKGTHSELMENCETYRQIATSQLSEKELSDNEKGGM